MYHGCICYGVTSLGRISEGQVSAQLVGSGTEAYSTPLHFNQGEEYHFDISNESTGALLALLWAQIEDKHGAVLLLQKIVDANGRVEFRDRVNENMDVKVNLVCIENAANACFARGTLSRLD